MNFYQGSGQEPCPTALKLQDILDPTIKQYFQNFKVLFNKNNNWIKIHNNKKNSKKVKKKKKKFGLCPGNSTNFLNVWRQQCFAHRVSLKLREFKLKKNIIWNKKKLKYF